MMMMVMIMMMMKSDKRNRNQSTEKHVIVAFIIANILAFLGKHTGLISDVPYSHNSQAIAVFMRNPIDLQGGETITIIELIKRKFAKKDDVCIQKRSCCSRGVLWHARKRM